MAGYSGTPLARKLGIRPGMRVALGGAPARFPDLLDPLPEDVTFTSRLAGAAQIVVIFAKTARELTTRLGTAKGLIPDDGAVWVAWPKKASKVATEIGEREVRASGLDTGLVDVKVCAIDDTWSGLKFVVRVADRRPAR